MNVLQQAVAVLGIAMPGAEFICGALFFKFSITSAMPRGCALHFPINTKHKGTSREPFCLGEVRLNLPELAWSERCSIVNDLYGGRIEVQACL